MDINPTESNDTNLNGANFPSEYNPSNSGSRPILPNQSRVNSPTFTHDIEPVDNRSSTFTPTSMPISGERNSSSVLYSYNSLQDPTQYTLRDNGIFFSNVTAPTPESGFTSRASNNFTLPNTGMKEAWHAYQQEGHKLDAIRYEIMLLKKRPPILAQKALDLKPKQERFAKKKAEGLTPEKKDSLVPWITQLEMGYEDELSQLNRLPSLATLESEITITDQNRNRFLSNFIQSIPSLDENLSQKLYFLQQKKTDLLFLRLSILEILQPENQKALIELNHHYNFLTLDLEDFDRKIDFQISQKRSLEEKSPLLVNHNIRETFFQGYHVQQLATENAYLLFEQKKNQYHLKYQEKNTVEQQLAQVSQSIRQQFYENPIREINHFNHLLFHKINLERDLGNILIEYEFLRQQHTQNDEELKKYHQHYHQFEEASQQYHSIFRTLDELKSTKDELSSEKELLEKLFPFLVMK